MTDRLIVIWREQLQQVTFGRDDGVCFVLDQHSGVEFLQCYSSQRHTCTMINHCDRRITHLSDTDISFVLFNISSKFVLYLECYLLSPKRHKKVSKQIKQSKIYISISKKSDMSITVIYHGMSLTVLSSMKQQSTGKHVDSYYSDFVPTGLCSYSLVLHAQQRN